MNSPSRTKREYVEQVLKLYTGLPETPTRYSRIDRRLAEELYDKQIAFEAVEMAMNLATGRRLIRSKDAPKLGPIRSLHYFLPVIDEIRSVPLSASYREYLRRKVAALQNTS